MLYTPKLPYNQNRCLADISSHSNQRHSLSLPTSYQAICCSHPRGFPLHFSLRDSLQFYFLVFLVHVLPLLFFIYLQWVFTKPPEVVKYWLLGFYITNQPYVQQLFTASHWSLANLSIMIERQDSLCQYRRIGINYLSVFKCNKSCSRL